MTDVEVSEDEARLLCLMETADLYHTPAHVPTYWAEALDAGALYTGTLLAGLLVRGLVQCVPQGGQTSSLWSISDAGRPVAAEARHREFNQSLKKTDSAG